MAEGTPAEVVQAAERLGVAPDDDPEAVRRAYLRAVKKHKPEVDPDGFKQVRGAYELLMSWGTFRARMAAQAQPPAPQPPPPAADVAPVIKPSKWREAGDLLEAKRHEEARALMIRLFEGEDANGPAPHPEQLLMVLLQLASLVPGAGARASLLAFEKWLERTQLELALTGQSQRWLLTRELMRLADDFPVELQAMIAAGLLDGDIDQLVEKVRAYQREQPERADGSTMFLADRAPALHQLLSPILSGAASEVHPGFEAPAREYGGGGTSSGSSGGWRVVFMIPLLMGLVRVCSSSSTTPSYEKPYAAASPSYSYVGPSGSARTSLPLPDLSGADVNGDVCLNAPMEACNSARALANAVQQKDCRMARSAMMGLQLSKSDAAMRNDDKAKRSIAGAIAYYQLFIDRCELHQP